MDPNSLPNRFNQTYIEWVLNSLLNAIANGDSNNAQLILNHYLELKPACKLTLTKDNSGSTDEMILRYLSSSEVLTSNPFIKPEAQNSVQTLPDGMANKISIGKQQSTSTIIQTNCSSLDQVNEEIYNKLIKAGNNRNDAKYAATGVTTLQQAMERLKSKKK